MSFNTRTWAAPLVCLALVACGEPELILDGERVDLRAPLDGAALPAAGSLPGSAPFTAPPQVANADWTHLGGSPSRETRNAALGNGTARVWAVNIGQGNNRGHRITAAPVVSDGRVFTLDSRATLSAVSTGGQLLWRADLTPATDRSDDASGGGIAVAGGRVFVTTGFGRLVAVDAASGDRLWTQELEATATGAPVVQGAFVYVVGRDGRGWAVDAATGTVVWTVSALTAKAGVVGGPSPAARGEAVVFPFGSGEVVAVEPTTGQTLWTGYAVGERVGRVYARIGDITGDPVIAGDAVYVGTQAGRTTAIEYGTGRALWTADYGAVGPVAVAGGSVFLISDQSELVRLDAATGAPVFAVELPYFTKERLRRRKDIFAHYGPVLAGGRLIVVSDDGQIRFFAPEDGRLLGTAELPGGAASEPAVANGTLYVVSENGQLNAFR